MKDHILEWNESFNNSFPARRFSSLVIDTNGRTSCITRYIRPLEPPQLHSDGIDMLPDHCAQFVSMIPLTTCNKFYESVCLTTDVKENLLTPISIFLFMSCFSNYLDWV